MLRRTFSFGRDLAREASRHHIARMSAALAFYGLFAVPPLLVFALIAAGAIFGDTEAREGLLHQVQVLAGLDARRTAAEVLDSMPRPGIGAPVSQGLGAVALFFAATAGFQQLEACLNQIVGRKKRRRGIQVLLTSAKRILGFVFVVLFSLLLLGLATLSVTLQLSPEAWVAELPASLRPLLSGVIQRAGLFLVAFLGLTVLYKLLPDRRVRWGSAAGGAVLAALAILLLKGGVAIYLRHSWRNVAFGAASSVVGLLVTFYAGAAVVLLGAVIAKIHHDRKVAKSAATASGEGNRGIS